MTLMIGQGSMTWGEDNIDKFKVLQQEVMQGRKQVTAAAFDLVNAELCYRIRAA